MGEALRWVQLWKEGKVRVWPAVYWLAAKEGVTVKDSTTKSTLWSSDGDNVQVLMKDGEIDMTRFAQSLMEFLQRSGMGPYHRGPGYRDMFDNPRTGAWKLDSVYGATESGEAKSYAEHYKSAGYQTKLVPKGDVIELWIKGSRLFVQEVPRGNPAPKGKTFAFNRGNPSTEGLTIVGACCILIETTRGRCTGKMGRVVGLPDGSVLIEGNFPKVPGGTVVAVEYMDDAKARAEGEGEGGIPWRHDMESERIALERTQGGLLMRRKNKPLWEMR